MAILKRIVKCRPYLLLVVVLIVVGLFYQQVYETRLLYQHPVSTSQQFQFNRIPNDSEGEESLIGGELFIDKVADAETPEAVTETSVYRPDDIVTHADLRTKYKARFQTIDDIKRFKDNINSDTNLFEMARQRHIINCSNVHEIKVGNFLGSGIFKSAYMGTFRKIKVAVKVVTLQNRTMIDCAKAIFGVLEEGTIDALQEALYFTHCEDRKTESLVHEIINHAVHDYPFVVRHLGYCLRDSEETRVKGNFRDVVLGRGIVSVYEYGTHISKSSLSKLPWLERVRYCRNVAIMLEFLENALFGSMLYDDIKLAHLVTIDGDLKLLDMDNYITPTEIICRREDLVSQKELERKRPGFLFGDCRFGVECVEGLCKGGNAVQNIHRFNERVFHRMFQNDTMPLHMYGYIRSFLDGLVNHKIVASDVKFFFQSILNSHAKNYHTLP